MEINLSEKIADHLDRVERLAEDAASDNEETYSSRSSAMTGLSQLLRELTKNQAEIYNMERLQIIEKVTIDTLNKYLTPEQREEFINELSQTLPE